MELSTPALVTPRLRLRAFEAADAADLFALHRDARVMRYWDGPAWTDPDRAEAFLARCAQLTTEGTGIRLAVQRGTDAAFLGWCGLSDYSSQHRSAVLSLCYGEAAWGHGYATESVHALLRWAIVALDLTRVQAEVDTRNSASARVLTKLGFVCEGTLRENCVVDGVVSDSWVYGLLTRELVTPPGLLTS